MTRVESRPRSDIEQFRRVPERGRVRVDQEHEPELLQYGQVHTPQFLGSDQVVQDCGSLQVQPALEGIFSLR